MTEFNLRPSPVIPALLAGIVVGTALGAGGCARAERERQLTPPVLPAARIDYARAAGPRQVIICDGIYKIQERVGSLMLQGWRAVPGTQALNNADQGMLVLEYRPALAKR